VATDIIFAKGMFFIFDRIKNRLIFIIYNQASCKKYLMNNFSFLQKPRLNSSSKASYLARLSNELEGKIRWISKVCFFSRLIVSLPQ